MLFPAPFLPRKSDVIAALDHQVDPVVDNLLAVYFPNLPQFHRPLARPRRFRKGEMNPGILDRGFNPLDFLQLPHAALGLPGAVLAHAVALDEALHLPDAFLLVLEG